MKCVQLMRVCSVCSDVVCAVDTVYVANTKSAAGAVSAVAAVLAAAWLKMNDLFRRVRVTVGPQTLSSGEVPIH